MADLPVKLPESAHLGNVGLTTKTSPVVMIRKANEFQAGLMGDVANHYPARLVRKLTESTGNSQ